MKKLGALLLSAALCCMTAVPAFAADVTTDGGSQSTTITYSVNADYIVAIPETVALDSDLTIKSTKAELARTNDTDYKITADVKQGENALKNNGTVAAFADVTTETAAAAITVSNAASPDANPIKAGSYSGTLTFTISYENA